MKRKYSRREKVRVLLNLLSDPAVIVDEKGHFLVVNKAFEEITGLKWKQIDGKPFFELPFILAESKTLLLENLKKRLQDASVELYEAYYIDKMGVKRCVEVKGKKIRYAGRPADLVVFHDITRRKENQIRLKKYSEQMKTLVEEKIKEIKENEEMLRAITNSTKEAIIVVNQDGGVEYWNSAAEQIFGYSQKEAVGKNVLKLILPAQYRDHPSFMELHKSGWLLQGKIVKITARRKDGTEFPAELLATLMNSRVPRVFWAYSEIYQNARK
ncbi:MAG: PAS domain S-box protein [Candidatus Bathyarchaeia archaeon]